MHDPATSAALTAVLAAPGREPALDQLVRLAAHVLPAAAAIISTAREGSEYFKAWYGLPEPLARRRTVPLGASLNRTVLLDGRVLAMENTGPTGNALAETFEWLSCLSVPVVFGDDTIGALWVVDRTPRTWEPVHIASLEEFAEAATAIIDLLAQRAELQTRVRARPADERVDAGNGFERQHAVTRLAAGVAHEFSNLLTTIRGRTELAMRESRGEPSAADLREILKATDRAATLNRQLLAFGREPAPKPETIRPDRVAADIENVLQHLAGEGAFFESRYATDTGCIVADMGGLERALVHLVSWLRDTAPEGGRFRVTTENIDVTEPIPGPARTLSPGPCVAVSVTHSLLRLDADAIARIIEPEFSPRGLSGSEGLTAALSFVRMGGGAMRITTDTDGTRLSMLFPVASERPDSRAETGEPVGGGGAETVLIVEDEESVRAVARRTLLLQGYTVMEAENGHVALELASSYPGRIHLMLTDVMMPGLTGPELAERLRELRPGTRVILMSGYVGQGPPLIDRNAGVAFLEKPFTPMTLARLVRHVLDRPD